MFLQTSEYHGYQVFNISMMIEEFYVKNYDKLLNVADINKFCVLQQLNCVNLDFTCFVTFIVGSSRTLYPAAYS